MDAFTPTRPVRWRAGSVATVCLAWLLLQLGGIFSPGLLDDVDSIYIEVAREMLHRHDFVTPYVNGLRFFDKPPLMYWMAAGSMRIFGEYDWAARLPLALGVLALLLAVYALGLRMFGWESPAAHPDRGALYAALATATGVGPYLYTRFFIPDILIALWMTLGLHLFLLALDRAAQDRAAGWASAGFAAVLALDLLTKGLIGLVFPLALVLMYLVLTRQVGLLRRLPLFRASLVFAAVALPWHLLAALRNPAIAMPPGLGLPARAGWAWFYLYNEHVARFLGRRIPHDYGQTPVWLFWLYAAVWAMPWTTFLPAAVTTMRQHLGHLTHPTARQRETGLVLTLWVLVVLGFFSLSSRQEYYSLPALPALFLMAGGALARAERNLLRWQTWFLLPLTSLVGMVCAWFAIFAPRPAPGADLSSLLASNPELYNLSLGHLFDLTGAAMGLFRLPLAAVAIAMLLIGPGAWLLRLRQKDHSATLTIAAGMVVALLAAHEALVRFNPILGSKDLSAVLNRLAQRSPDQVTILDGEFTSGSSVVFYTRQQVHLVDGRVNGLWFGGFWPDAPAVFEDTASLQRWWSGARRVNLFTYQPALRQRELAVYGPVYNAGSAGGKTILTNQPL